MKPLSFVHRIHGAPRHDAAIFLTERMCVRNGCEILDGSWMKGKGIVGAEPDVIVRAFDSAKDAYGTKTPHSENVVIELESKLTTVNREKKQLQFKQSLANCELIIVELNRCPGPMNDWREMERYIAAHLWFVEKDRLGFPKEHPRRCGA
jgi:hypothetical protein